MFGSWASPDDVWVKMFNKELKYVHDRSYLQRQPRLQPKMRAILLDWLLEVSEVYSLHRQTTYLAQDFFDRYMLTQEDVRKESLQLLGITALFIASKTEVRLWFDCDLLMMCIPGFIIIQLILRCQMHKVKKIGTN